MTTVPGIDRRAAECKRPSIQSGMSLRLALFICSALLFPSTLAAQPPTRQDSVRIPVRNTPCPTSAWAITVQIVDDATGNAVREDEATVKVTHTASSRHLRDANELPIEPYGKWLILTDGDLATVAPAGEKLTVEVRRTGRSAVRREVTIGRDPSGCHITLIGEVAPIRLR